MSPENITLRFVSQINTNVYIEAVIYSKHSVEILNALRLSLHNLYYIHDIESGVFEVIDDTSEQTTLAIMNSVKKANDGGKAADGSMPKRVEERINKRVKIDAPEDALTKIPQFEKRALGGFLENYYAQCNYYNVDPSLDIKFCMDKKILSLFSFHFFLKMGF